MKGDHPMNNKVFVKIFEALHNAGLTTSEASKIALRHAASNKNVVQAPTHVNTSTTITGGILEFANRRKGQVWSLQAVARHLGTDPNSVSGALTKLIANGKVRRMGRGQYSS